LCILGYLKTYLLQVVQGRLVGMGQSKARQGNNVLLMALQATLSVLGGCPHSALDGVGSAPRGGRGQGDRAGCADGGVAADVRSTRGGAHTAAWVEWSGTLKPGYP
jgi:hypothetical protein